MYCSREDWNRKLKAFGSNLQLDEPEHQVPELQWSRRVISIVKCLPPGFQGLLSIKQSRSSPADLLQLQPPELEIFWTLPRPKSQLRPAQPAATQSTKESKSNDPRPVGKGKQPEYPSAMSLDPKPPVRGASIGPAQPPSNRGTTVGPNQPRPQHRGARVSPAQPPGNQGASTRPSQNPRNQSAHAVPAQAPGIGGAKAKNTGQRQARTLNRLRPHRNNPPPEN